MHETTGIEYAISEITNPLSSCGEASICIRDKKVLGRLSTYLLRDAHMYSHCDFLHQVMHIFHPLILTSLESMISGFKNLFHAKH